MEKRKIGSLSVSLLGLGGNNFGLKLSPDDTARVVHAAVDAGVTFFDTADRYGHGEYEYSHIGASEEYLGRALGSRRADVVIATKFGKQMVDDDPSTGGGSRRWVRQACEDSLRRLGTDYIDLYQMLKFDPETPLDETNAALTELVEEGKVREFGFVEFTLDQIADATAAGAQSGRRQFVTMQTEYSLLRREAEETILPALQAHGLLLLPFFPLASGLLTGKYGRGQRAPEGSRLTFWEPRPHQVQSDENFAVLDRLTAFAEDRGHTLLELAFAWVAANPLVATIHAGATTPEQVVANASAVGWTLTADDLQEVENCLTV